MALSPGEGGTRQPFPPPDVERFQIDEAYHASRMRAARAFVRGDLDGYAPADPRALMDELVGFIEALYYVEEESG